MTNNRSSAGGRLVARAAGSTSHSVRCNGSGKFVVGSQVSVPLGARRHDATVIEQRKDRVRVNIHVNGADEPIISSYSVSEIDKL